MVWKFIKNTKLQLNKSKIMPVKPKEHKGKRFGYHYNAIINGMFGSNYLHFYH